MRSHERRAVSCPWASLTVLLLGGLLVAPSPASAQWPRMGGPDGNFKVEAGKLAMTWPEAGPPVVWAHDLGDGYSGMVIDGGLLFTMARNDPDEKDVVVALDVKTGKTVWKKDYEAKFSPAMDMRFGPGPHSTPAVQGGRLVTVGCTGVVQCLDARTGEGRWRVDLGDELGMAPMGRGYSASPLVHDDLVILPVGGAGQAIVAFSLDSGEVVWKAQDFAISQASPVMARPFDKDEIIVFMAAEVAGIDPGTGKLLWSHPHPTKWGANISNPVIGDGNLVFLSSAYGMGSRCVKLSRGESGIAVDELWTNRKMKIHHGNAVRIGSCVYGSSGDFGPAFLMAVDVESGEVAWTERGFSKANLVYGDGKLIILDEDGNLAITTVTPEGLTVHARAQVLTKNCWTAPTLVGTRLYVRDRKQLLALELGENAG